MARQYIDVYSSSRTDKALLAGIAGEPKAYTKGGEYARGSVGFSDVPAADSTITLNDIVVQFSESASDGTAAGTALDPILVNIKGSLTLTLDEAVTVLNGSANEDLAVATYSNVSGTTLLAVADTRTATFNTTYTIVASAESNGTASGATMSGGQSDVALSLNDENIDIALTDSNDQYFSMGDGKEFQKKVIVLSAKSTGNAVISVNGSDVTLTAAGQYLVYQFLDGDWRSLVDPTITAINDLAVTDGNFIVGNGTTWVVESGNTVLASIGTTATAAEITRSCDLSTRLVSVTATGSVTEAAHEGRDVYITGTAANTQTLPEATGSGGRYRFIIGEVNTNGTVFVVADTTNANFIGSVNILDLDAAAQGAYGYPANCDTITLNGTTTGGQIGDFIELVDVAADVWMVFGQLQVPTGSNPATPFSAAV